jgi:hypothetical protein
MRGNGENTARSMTIVAHEPQLKQKTLKPPAKIGDLSIPNWDNKDQVLDVYISS